MVPPAAPGEPLIHVLTHTKMGAADGAARWQHPNCWVPGKGRICGKVKKWEGWKRGTCFLSSPAQDETRFTITEVYCGLPYHDGLSALTGTCCGTSMH